MFEKHLTQQQVIEIIGKTLTHPDAAKYNGTVGVYPSIEEIIFWDMAKKQDLEKFSKIIFALLDYLGLEYKKENFIIKKKKK